MAVEIDVAIDIDVAVEVAIGITGIPCTQQWNKSHTRESPMMHNDRVADLNSTWYAPPDNSLAVFVRWRMADHVAVGRVCGSVQNEFTISIMRLLHRCS